MSNNLDLDKEGVVETTCNSTTNSDDDNSDIDDNDHDSSPDFQQNDNDKVIESNITRDGDESITNKSTANDNEIDDDSDDESDDDDDNETIANAANAANKNEEAKNNDIDNNNNNNNNDPQNSNNTNGFFNGFLILLIGIIIRYYYTPSSSTITDSIPICSKLPDSSTKFRLQCPKCDAFDNSGKCIIYVPYSSQQTIINGKGSDGTLNNYPCTQFKWELDDEYVLSANEDGEELEMVFISPGREDIELTVYINITDYRTGHIIYYKEKTCDIELVIYEAPYFGIDLGTTYSCIAYQKPYINTTTNKRDTNIVIMDESKMEYCIPSSIYFDIKHNIYIGNNAKKMALHNNDYINYIYDIKRIIGRPSDDPSLIIFNNTHSFNLNLNNKYPLIEIPNWSKNITPEQLLAVLLVKLVQTASNQFGVPYLKDVVVSIPAIFHDAQRKAVHTACQIAGLNAKLLVVEPSAASIAHIYYAPISKLKEFNKYFMTLDIGGGTTDVSVLRCTGLHCEVLGVAGNSSLGGIDFDNVIAHIMINKILKKTKNKIINDKLYDEIRSKSEMVKKALSTDDEYMVRLQNEKENDYIELIITRKEFEQHPTTIKLINCIINLAKQAMFDDNPLSTKKGNEHLTNIKAILLIGGTVKIPLIQQMLSIEFVKDNDIKKTQLIYPLDDPQLMVVKGSGIIGGSMAYLDSSNIDILHNQIPEVTVDDVLPMSFGFDVCIIDYNQEDGHKCGVMDILISKNSKYPTKGSGIYCQKIATASTATLMLYEGDDNEVKNNLFLTKLEILQVPTRSEYECNNIMVELSINNNGIANITAKVNDQIFSKQLPVKSNDAHFTQKQIKLFNQEVMSWFN